MNTLNKYLEDLVQNLTLVRGENEKRFFEDNAEERFFASVAYWAKNSPTVPCDFLKRSALDLESSPENDLIRAYSPLREEFGLLLMGSAGVGKTYVLTAILADAFRELYLAGNTRLLQYSNVGYLLAQLRANRDLTVFEEHRTVQCLFLDDLGAENVTDYAREQLFTILDLRCQNKLPTIISTNLSFNEISAKYGERFSSRLKQMCVPIVLKGSDRRDVVFRNNLQTLKNKAESV